MIYCLKSLKSIIYCLKSFSVILQSVWTDRCDNWRISRTSTLCVAVMTPQGASLQIVLTAGFQGRVLFSGEEWPDINDSTSQFMLFLNGWKYNFPGLWCFIRNNLNNMNHLYCPNFLKRSSCHLKTRNQKRLHDNKQIWAAVLSTSLNLFTISLSVFHFSTSFRSSKLRTSASLEVEMEKVISAICR